MRRRTTDKSAKEKAAEVTGTPVDRKTSAKEVSLEGVDRHQKPVGSNANKRAGSVKMEGFETIIDNLFVFDADAAYQEVRDFLTLSGKASRAEYGMLVDALDQAAEMAVTAHQLLANARVAFSRFEVDSNVLSSTLREQCVQEIMAKFNDPDDKTVTKKPTIADIEAYMASNYYDEISDQKGQLTKAKESCNYIEGLVKALEQRQRDLRQMVASARGN